MQNNATEIPSEDRLDSWKDIAAHLRREVRTVQLWEKNEGLPVHRHTHRKRGTVYAYRSELDAWWSGRRVGMQEQNPSEAPRRRRGVAITLAGALGIVVICAAVWLGAARGPSAPVEAPRIVPLTSDPGSEMGGAFSPDGNQVAFAWKPEGKHDFDVYVKVVGSDTALRLTSTSETDEVDAAWSPDGGQIAFFRSRPDGSCSIYTVTPLGGPERLVVELSGKVCGCWSRFAKLSTAQLSWSADSKWLARPGVSLISMETGEERELTSPRGSPDLYPAFSPDGESLAFVRWVNAAIQELYVVSTAGGKPVRLPTQGQRIYGVAWTPDGQELIYSSGKSDLSEAELWRVSRLAGSPRRVIEGDRARLPSVARRGRRLAFTRMNSDTNIWQARVGSGRPQADTARRVNASTRAEGRPALSPDGQRVAFMSERSGTFQVWVCDRDGSNARQLTFFPERGAGAPAWSPDGRQIAFDAWENGNLDIYVIAADGDAPRRLTSEKSNEVSPTWSRDGQWVYFASTRTGRHEVFKVPVAGEGIEQVTKHGGQLPVESPDGKYVYYEKGPTFPREFEPWRVPVDGNTEERVLENLGSRWTVAEDGFYYYEPAQVGDFGGPWFLKFIEFATGKKRVVAELTGRPLIGHRPAISPDRQTFLYVQLDVNETDVMLMDEFR